MQDWQPDLYLRFETERTQPARDLLARVALDTPSTIADLGCGPGNSTALLAQRFPEGLITGIDNSAAMLAKARSDLPQCTFENRDIARWQPRAPVDLIFANATLQWLPDHDALFPRLISHLAPGGIFAVQMPDNHDEPTHQLMRALADEEPWAETIRNSVTPRTGILPIHAYYDLLAPLAQDVLIWRTIYFHIMPSAGAIVDWLRGTSLRSYLDPLSPDQQRSFLNEYETRIAKAYPLRANGKILLPFPRLFMIGHVSGS